MHRSTTAVADTVEWIELTTGDTEDPSDDTQRWYWASIGHAIALVGGLTVSIGTTALVWRLLERSLGSGTRADHGIEHGGGAGFPKSTLVGLSTLLALSIYPLYAIGIAIVPTTQLTHQELTHGNVLWFGGSILLGAGFVHWRHGGVDRTSLRRLVPDRTTATRALAAAAAGVAVLYTIVAIADAVPGGALNAWIVGFTSLSTHRWVSLAVYVLPVTAAAVAFTAGLENIVEPGSDSLARNLTRSLAVSCGGLLVFLAVQYVPLFLGYGMPVPSVGPLAITATSATGLLAIATVVATVVTRLTDSSLTSGILTGLLVTWMIVGTSPIHVTPF